MQFLSLQAFLNKVASPNPRSTDIAILPAGLLINRLSFISIYIYAAKIFWPVQDAP